VNRDPREVLLAEFRAALFELDSVPEAPAEIPPPVDFGSLLAQFTALRHDVSLQTKAARQATEAAQQAIAQLAANPAAEPRDETSPLLKALFDIGDALLTAQKQVERSRQSIEALASRDAKPGFFARLFAAKPSNDAGPKLATIVAGLGDGYAISLRRIEAVLPQFGIEPIACLDVAFDAEAMEAVEAVADSGRPSGTVVAEVRRGYRRGERVLRFAQVKVAV